MTVQLSRSAASKAKQLAKVQVETIGRINATIGQIRSRYGTNIPFQDGVYISKLEEARSFTLLQVPPIDMLDFPLLASEIGITGDTAAQVAQVWLNMHALWMATIGSLETLRLGTVKAIEEATTITEVQAAEAGFTASLEALA